MSGVGLRSWGLCAALSLCVLAGCSSIGGASDAAPAALRSLPVDKLSWPEEMPNAKFGTAIAVSGERYLIGAPGYLRNGTPLGSAYLFDKKHRLLHRFEPVAPVAHAQFGEALLMTDRWIIIAAPERKQRGRPQVGAIDVFDAQSFEHLYTIEPPQAISGARFGTSLALADEQLWVGAIMTPVAGKPVGRVYAFDLTTRQLTGVFDDPSPSTADLFGRAIALTDERVFISASTDRSMPRASGQVHIFDRRGGALLQTLDDPDPTRFDLFGEALLIADDRLYVSSPRDNKDELLEGNLHVFSLEGEFQTTVTAPIPQANQYFGFPLVRQRDKLIVGAPHARIGDQYQPGRAYVLDAESLQPTAVIKDVDPAEDDQFSLTMTPYGRGLLIGAPGDDAHGNAGAVYLLKSVR